MQALAPPIHPPGSASRPGTAAEASAPGGRPGTLRCYGDYGCGGRGEPRREVSARGGRGAGRRSAEFHGATGGDEIWDDTQPGYVNTLLVKIAIEIVDHPIKLGGSFHRYVKLPEGRLS